MPYYEVANLVTVTKKNMIEDMLCAYGTLSVASGPIYIVLLYSINPFRLMVTVAHNASVHLQLDTDRARRHGNTRIGGR